MPVHDSIERRDVRFVARTIRLLGLNPFPVRGYYFQFPHRWEDRAKGREIQLESYEWGAVAFVEDRGRAPWFATFVLIGRIDWERGVVFGTVDEIADPIPIPWIEAIDWNEGKEMPQANDAIPECLSYHDHGPTCDGGVNPITGAMEVACLWRPRCYALKLYLAEKNETIERFLEDLPNPVELHAKLAEIERERVSLIPPPAHTIDDSSGLARGTLAPKPRKKSKRRKKRVRDPARFEPLLVLLKAFTLRLKKLLGEMGYGWVARRGMALPGDCFVHHVTRRSNYATIYLATAKDLYPKVAVVTLKTSSLCIDVAFQADFDRTLGCPTTRLRKTHASFAPVEWHGIRTKKTARKAARLLVKMIRKGIVKLPKPPKREEK